MATREFMFEILTNIQDELASFRRELTSVRRELTSVRRELTSVRADVAANRVAIEANRAAIESNRVAIETVVTDGILALRDDIAAVTVLLRRMVGRTDALEGRADDHEARITALEGEPDPEG